MSWNLGSRNNPSSAILRQMAILDDGQWPDGENLVMHDRHCTVGTLSRRKPHWRPRQGVWLTDYDRL